MSTPGRTTPGNDIFREGGEMGALMASIDWSRTPLGPVASWSQALRTMVGLLLRNRFPLLLWWGPQYVQLYNDAYRPIAGQKHPRSMGQPASECFSEIWSIIGPMIDAPFRGEPATTSEDLSLLYYRRGFLEEAHFKVAYSPVPDETVQPTGIGGVIATVAETTEQVVGERQLSTLRELGARTAPAKTPREACALAAATLQENSWDVPFALFYLVEPDGRRATLAARTGFGDSPSEAAPAEIYLEADGPWPLARILGAGKPEVLRPPGPAPESLPRGRWTEAPREAIVLPLHSPDQARPYGVMICGVSPHRLLDDGYLTFFGLAAQQVIAAIRTARALEEERRRAEELAELDRAKTAFFSNVSHEFRTPLTLILGPLEEALATMSSTEERRNLEAAHRNALRLLRLVNTLLEFSRIEAGRVQARFEPLDLAALTGDLAGMFRTTVERGGLGLEVDCSDVHESAWVDRDMWEKILLNLVSNAFKFTFEGRISVRLRVEPREFLLEVADTGVGIPAAEIPRLFDRFHRVQGARSRSHEGSGIGLALVHDLVALHGGTVGVASTVGKGTTFAVRIPRGKDHLPADRLAGPRTHRPVEEAARPYIEEALRWLPEEQSCRAPAAEPESPGRRQERILLVDDNADMRSYVERLLSRTWTVETAANGREALEKAVASPPDLILSDVMMPVLDGFQLLRAVREHAGLREIPVILLSARAGEESTIEGLDAGADDYLIKPFAASELLARVQSHLRLSRLRREAADAIRRLNGDLERRVQERTETLEETVRELNTFAYTVAHDLRAPLRAVHGLGQLVLEDHAEALGPEGRDHLGAMIGSAARMDQLICDLLEYSALSRNGLTLGPVPLRDLVERVLVDMDPELRQRRADVQVDGILPTVQGHDVLLRHAVANLISNAAKFVAAGTEPRIRVWAERRGEDCRLVVEDNGIGIASQHRDRLFRVFERLHGREEYSGTGIGLAIVRRAAERMGGGVGVDSEPGRGSRFYLHLPLADPSGPALEKDRSCAASQGA